MAVVHKPWCSSNIVLSSFPPIYQECDCGAEEQSGMVHVEECPQAEGKWDSTCICHRLLRAGARGYMEGSQEAHELVAILLQKLGGRAVITPLDLDLMDPHAVILRYRASDGFTTIFELSQYGRMESSQEEGDSQD